MKGNWEKKEGPEADDFNIKTTGYLRHFVVSQYFCTTRR